MHIATSTLWSSETKCVSHQYAGERGGVGKEAYDKFKILQAVKWKMVTYEVMIQTLLTNFSVLRSTKKPEALVRQVCL